MKRHIFAILLLVAPLPAAAQDSIGRGEIIVTAQRREAEDFDANVPAVGLRRRADFAVQQLTVIGDTRDEARRHDEMYSMIRGAIELAGKRGVQLATGDTVVEPLTLANYRSLTLANDRRPDSEKVSFLVKVPLAEAGDAKGALDRIDAFVKAVPTVGRALIERTNDFTLSIVRPDQYREQIVALVAEDARSMAGRFGPDYAVEARGIERPVEWSRAGVTDVFLYVPYQLTVVPKR